jgi:hypothetical protein
MGWWKIDDESSIEVGDFILDEVRHFLESISRQYEKDLHRKPTLDELQYLLTLGFSANINSDILSDFDELRVQKVTIKTEKRKKRVKPEIGDIFSFKINHELYGFGRLVFNLRAGTVAEIFDCTARSPVFDRSKEGKWLIDPILINDFILLDKQSEGEWGIISKNPGYSPGEKFGDVFFSWKDYKDNYKLEGVKKQGVITDEATAKKYPRYVAINDEEVKKLVLNALRKQ